MWHLLSPHVEHVLKMDEALLTVHNQLPEGITLLFVSDYCYKVFFRYLSLLCNSHIHFHI